MANWLKLSREVLLGDGKLEDRETQLVRQEIFSGGQIDDAELAFLLDVKKGATAVVPSFNQLIIDAVKKQILQDGVIGPQEADWLRRWLLTDGQINPPQKKLLQELKAGARQTCPEFESLYQKLAG